MNKFYLTLLGLVLLLTAGYTGAQAQSVLNPSDTLVNYDSTHKPNPPAWNEIGKWVRTPRMGWNTSQWKAYHYKGISFRLKFPRTYNPTAADGKKYPMIAFWHGLGEASTVYDNEFHLLLGMQYFQDQIANGTYDGYVIAMQTQLELTGFFGTSHYQAMREIIDYMVVNNKLDPFRVVNNGLSSGGIASMDFFLANPAYSAGSIAMSAVGNYSGSATVEKMKFSPVWYANGGQDPNPSPAQADAIVQAFAAAGAPFKRYFYPAADHNTWDNTWSEADFWPFVNRAYASNPWALFNKTQYQVTEAVNSTIGLAPGFDAYQWRKNGVVITGATTNQITATEAGTYDARVMRNGWWSEWSRIPVIIRQGSGTTNGSTIHIEAENYSSMFGIQTEGTNDVGGGQNIGWQDTGDWMEYGVNIPAAGTYTLRFRVATPFNNPQFQVRNANGVIAAVNVPSTGNFQTWQTISVSCFLSAGPQTLRLYTTNAAGGWNLNWWEIGDGTATTPSNQPPTVNAGAPQTITLPANSVSLTGTATDPDGTIASYAWTKVSGPAATIASPAAAQTSITGLTQGSYVFRLTVTDNGGATAFSDVTVTVNAAPSSGTGTGTRIEAESYTQMSGIQTEGTNDVGGGLNVGWQDTGDWMDYSVNVPSAGSYTVSFRVASMFTGPQFQLRNSGGTALATLAVPNTGSFQTWQTITATVNLPAGLQTLRIFTTNAAGGWNINWWMIAGGTAPVNQAPTVSAGAAQTITLPTSSVTLSGSASDPDGTIVSYAWTRVSGPNTPSFGSPASAQTTVSGLVQGSYVFRLTATDNSGASASGDVAVTVNPAPPSGGGGGGTVSLHIEAESYSAMRGIQVENTADIGGGQNVGWIDDADWMDYVVTIPTAGTYTVSFRVATEKLDPQFQLRNSAGTALATVTVPRTGTFQTWQTINATVTLPAGQQTLRIYTTRANGGWNINWWEIRTPGTTTVTSSVGVEATQLAEPQALKLYPNPVEDQAVIQVDNVFTGRMQVQVLAQNGAMVRQFQLQKPSSGRFQQTLSLGALPRGQYILRVVMAEGVQSTKLIKR